MADHIRAITQSVKPSIALVDETIAIHLSGLTPGESATLQARMLDEADRPWTSQATFVADASGCIDPALQAPITGSYSGVEPMGLFWSTASEDAPGANPFLKDTLAPSTITITSSAGGRVVATSRVTRLYVAPEVVRTPVRAEGLVGTLFVPAGAGPFPGVAVMGGSGGGLQEGRAAVLASHGFATLALAYFHYEGLPDALRDIPLEYFEKALHWLAAQPRVAGDRLAVMGTSRGGELALLLGATFHNIQAVIGYAPSSLVNGSVGGPGPGAAWTCGGRPIPYMRSSTAMSWEALVARYPNQPIPITPLFLSELGDREAVAAATIPVENMRCPVLLISGTDDQMWPSSLYSEMVVKRLKEKGFQYPCKHVACEEAGHTISHPYPPMTMTHSRHPVTGDDFAYGGTPLANARAAERSWAEVLGFLRMHL